MGRGRLRRGYSLEVIFEEDPDFCSHLDSLDSVAIRFGVKEVDDTISVDSLVEEYQIRFQASADKEHVFRSLDGIWDVKDMDSCFVEWDEFSTDSLSKMPPATTPSQFESVKSTKLDGDVEIPTNGRRSRVSRRQIVEASWVFDSSEDSSSGSGNEVDPKEEAPKEFIDPPDPDPKGQGQDSEVTGDQMKLITTSVEVHHPSSPIRLPIDIRLHKSDEASVDNLSPPRALFSNLCNLNLGMRVGLGVCDGAEKDNLDSYLSTRTDDMEANAYNFADPFNDNASCASTTYESSASTSSTSSSTGSVCTVNSRPHSNSSTPKSSPSASTSTSPSETPFSPASNSNYRSNLNVELKSRFQNLNKRASSTSPSEPNQNQNTMTPDQKNTPDLKNAPTNDNQITTDVKRVRALFEIPNSRKSSLGEESTGSGSSGSSTRLYTKKPPSPTNSSGSGGGNSDGVPRKLKNLGLANQHQIVDKVLRSAYSQFNLNQQQRVERGQLMDFAELLVNDNVVIEDSNDFSPLTLRNRNRGDIVDSKFRIKDQTGTVGYTSLRRSRSMGTGISSIGGEYHLDKLSGIRTSRTSIIAEEMPAPDTVKNVRTVFEQILKMRNSVSNSNSDPQNPQNQNSPQNSNQSLQNNSIGNFNSFSIIKKSLSSVKSNPTSKIYRSESMRDDFPVGPTSLSYSPIAKKFGKTLDNFKRSLTDINQNNNNQIKKQVERKYSEPIKFAPKINSPVRPLRSFAGNSNFEPFENSNKPPTLTEEDLSLLSSLNDDNPPKFVSPDVLQRIRSYGTTTTYFGGQVIAQTVKNKKLPLSRRHTLMDFQDFHPGDFSCSSASSSNGIPSITSTNLKHQQQEEFFTPPTTPTTAQRFNNRRYEDETYQYEPRGSPMLDLETMFAGVSGLKGGINTKPRIISVMPKSPSGSGSPTGSTKSVSPVGSIIEGRGTPEGCEGQDHLIKCQWIDEIPPNMLNMQKQDGNNNEITSHSSNPTIAEKKFSQVTEGAWF